jgi:hypothetical protein
MPTGIGLCCRYAANVAEQQAAQREFRARVAQWRVTVGATREQFAEALRRAEQAHETALGQAKTENDEQLRAAQEEYETLWATTQDWNAAARPQIEKSLQVRKKVEPPRGSWWYPTAGGTWLGVWTRPPAQSTPSRARQA